MVGISWIDAVFISTKVTMLSVAVSLPLCRLSRRIASSPGGVAALPKPSRFALRFMEMLRKVSESASTSGYSRLSSGADRRESFPISPLSFAIRMKPDHMISMPLIEISSSTAPPAASSSPSLTAPKFPLIAAYSRDTAIIAPNTYDTLSPALSD